MGITNYAKGKMLDTIRGVSFSVTSAWAQLHIGDPGEGGTANIATESSRQSLTFDPASGGTMDIGLRPWLFVEATEDYTHWSIWDSMFDGNCLWTGAFSETASVIVGDTFLISGASISLN